MQEQKNKVRRLVIGYPFALVAIAVSVNLIVLGVKPIVVALPADSAIAVLAVCAALLLLNHTWLMTSTELTRVRFALAATPEEREQLTLATDEDPAVSREALERRHNAHRNTTENTVYFVVLALLLVFASPSDLAVLVWPLCYAFSRLGYTLSYLGRKTNARGAFMSSSLLSLYGMSSYLLIAAVV